MAAAFERELALQLQDVGMQAALRHLLQASLELAVESARQHAEPEVRIATSYTAHSFHVEAHCQGQGVSLPLAELLRGLLFSAGGQVQPTFITYLDHASSRLELARTFLRQETTWHRELRAWARHLTEVALLAGRQKLPVTSAHHALRLAGTPSDCPTPPLSLPSCSTPLPRA